MIHMHVVSHTQTHTHNTQVYMFIEVGGYNVSAYACSHTNKIIVTTNTHLHMQYSMKTHWIKQEMFKHQHTHTHTNTPTH